LRGVFVANNTVYKNRAGGITAPETGISGVTIVNHAVHAGGGTRAFPAPQTGVRLGGNVDCTTIPCFANPEQRNLPPRAGSLLKGAGVYWGGAWVPREDVFGVRWSVPPLPGAFERPSGPVSLIPL